MRLVEVLTGDAQSAIHWLEELGVEFTRENGGYRLARCGGATREAAAPGRRPHRGTRSRRRCATRSRRRHGTPVPEQPRCRRSSRPRTAGARPAASTSSTRRRSSSPPAAAASRGAQERGELSTNHPNATGEVTRIALDLGAEARDLDELQYHPNGGAWPETMQGYSIPETTRAYGAVLLNADGEEFTDSLGPRDVVTQAIFDEVEKGKGVETPGRPPRRLPRHDADRGGRRRDLAAVHAPPLPRRGDRPAARADPHLPRAPLPERRPHDRHARPDHARRALRLRRDRRAARTGATA